MSKELRTLWETINSGGYKQAHAKISKELKKHPDNAYYLSVSSYVYLKQNKTDQALELARKVADSGPTNGHVLNLLVQIFIELDLIDECNSMFEAANRKAPSNVEIVDLWFETMVEAGHVKGLQKASMVQQKVSGKRDSSLRAVFHMYLAYSIGSESEKKLFPMLAARILEKLKPYQNVQEVYVQALALKMQDVDKLIEYLQSDEVTQFGSLDLSLMLVDTLREHEKFRQLYDVCVKELETSDENWVHWNNMNLAAKELGLFEQTHAIIKKATVTRNSALAAIELYSLEEKYDAMLEALKEYFKVFGSKRCCIEDLTRFISMEGFSDRRQTWVDWLESVFDEPQKSDIATATWKVNVERFKFMVTVDVSDSTVDRNIRLYQSYVHLLKDKDPKDYHTADDFLLIAASALLKKEKTEYKLEKAAVLLEVASRSDQHQFYVRLWLIRIYMILGAFTKAQVHYKELSIKMLQQETLSYMLGTRLSSIYPNEKFLSENDDIYDQSEEFPQYIKFGYNKGAYTQIEGFMDLHRKFKLSLNRKLLDIERIKSERLMSDKANSQSMEKDINDRLEDNRDFISMWNSGLTTAPKLSDTITIGPIQGSEWAKTQQLREKIIRRLINGEVDELKQLHQQMRDTLTSASDEFTSEEKWSIDFMDTLVQHSLKKEAKASYDALEAQLDSLPLSTPEHLTWEWLHRAFTVLETYSVVSGYLIRLKTSKTQVKSNISAGEHLRTVIQQKTKLIKAQALEIKDSRNKRCQKIVDILSPWAEERKISSSIVEDVIDSICASQDKSLTTLRNVSL
ncbi:hypothetical protein TRICI_005747 [Trichomonascus ciferrii]|uniref:N-terminal acetyltransferase B complex subunit MDM20 n=1 Tax=Trichomonascus ciferrii TaxID=44093 RepID=A0A642UPX9_9ASCO|nr:hypothetical protein TRICI_005747 [Trichomonascus ciferrii]